MLGNLHRRRQCDWDDVRKPVRIAVRRPFRRAVRRVGAAICLQFLVDDYRGTVVDGMVEDELFLDGADEYPAGKLRTYGPLDFTAPPRVPDTHWWWSLSARREFGKS